MAQTHFLPLPNKDLISSFSFNYYGTRLAVSSLDHHLYVLSSDLDTGRWPQDTSSTQAPNPPQASGSDPPPSNSNQSNYQRSQRPNIHAWTAHEGPVIRVVWSDPIHGEILASAGADGTVRIWEEDTRRLDHPTGDERVSMAKSTTTTAAAAGARLSKQSNNLSPGGWYQQSILADSNRAIRDIGFSPSESSLRLASISTDHHLRLYECLETSNSFSTDNWNLIINIDLSVIPIHPCNSSDHLNPNPNNLNLVGGSNPGPGPNPNLGFHQHPSFTSVRGFDPSTNLNTSHQKHNTSHPSTTNFNLMNPLSGLKSSFTPPFNQTSGSSGSSISTHNLNPSDPQIESIGGWALSWCPETYWGDILATSSGSNGLIRLFKFSPQSQWENFGVLNPFNNPDSKPKSTPTIMTNTATSATSAPVTTTGNSIVSPISSLAWAPPCGRDYHLIAAGHRDGRARIWKLVPPGLSFHQAYGTKGSSSHWTFELDTELEDHVDPHQPPLQPNTTNSHKNQPSSSSFGTGGVGKCDWNVTGTVLSTSGSDGKVRIWKMGYTSRWVNTAEINCIDQEDEDQHTNTTGITVS